MIGFAGVLSAAGIAVCVLLPALLAPALVALGWRLGWTVRSFRGRELPFTLGLAWGVWAVGQMLTVVGVLLSAPSSSAATALRLAGPSGLVAGTVALGLVDDVRGDRSARGFGGHLSALLHCRVTTGLVKMLGVGVLSLWAAWGVLPEQSGMLRWLLAAGVMALSANLLNLLDVRPGRALKAYGMGILVTVAAVAIASPRAYAANAFDGILTLLVLIAPALAVWRYDLGEKAVLGDAGSNAGGALVGVVLVSYAPGQVIMAAFVILLALNLLSERVSFSAVIERNRLLRVLDRLGRSSDDISAAPPAASVVTEGPSRPARPPEDGTL